MSGPTTTNPFANFINKGVAALGNAGVQAVEALIIVDVPFLGLPVIKQIWQWIFGWIASYFITAAENGVTFAIIDVETDIEVNNMSSALAAVVAAEKTGDAAQIKAAITAYANAQSSLVHDDGSSHAS